MNNAVIHGSYFSANFGDVLLWHQARSMILDERRTAKIQAVNVPRRLEFFYPAERLQRSSSPDMLFFCGGGYFCPPTSDVLKWSVRNFLRHKRALGLVKGGCPTIFAGVGVGDITFQPFRRLLRDALKASQAVYVRDIESAEAVARLSNVETKVVPDLAFAHLANAPQYQRIPRSGVALHADFGGTSSEDIKLFIFAAQRLIEKFGFSHFLVDCKSSRSLADVELVKSCLFIEGPVKTFNGNCEEFLGSIACAKVVVTTKLHVGICATAMDIPVLAVPKHHKTTRFYSQTGLPHSLVTSEDSVDDFINRDEVAVLPSSSPKYLALRSVSKECIQELRSKIGEIP